MKSRYGTKNRDGKSKCNSRMCSADNGIVCAENAKEQTRIYNVDLWKEELIISKTCS